MKSTLMYPVALLLSCSPGAVPPSVVPAQTPPAQSPSLCTQSVSAITYSNLGPGQTFDTDETHGWTINGSLGPPVLPQGIAEKFTPSATVPFTSAQIALFVLDPGSVLVSLHADSGGLPGAILEQIAITGLTAPRPPEFPLPAALVTVTSVLRPLLRAGAGYWLSVVAGTPGFRGGWMWNSIGDVSTDANCAGTFDGVPTGTWYPGCFAAPLPGIDMIRSAFQINGPAPCDFSTQPNIERCFGGVGKQCEGAPSASFLKDENTCCFSGWMSVGSILHDQCCVLSGNTGVQCAKDNGGLACGALFTEAVCDALAGRQWPHVFGPYPAGNNGDDVNQPFGVPAGTRLPSAYQVLCPTRRCRLDPAGTTDVCGENCVCE